MLFTVLSSYCVLVDAKIRASDKDLPVNWVIRSYKGIFGTLSVCSC